MAQVCTCMSPILMGKVVGEPPASHPAGRYVLYEGCRGGKQQESRIQLNSTLTPLQPAATVGQIV